MSQENGDLLRVVYLSTSLISRSPGAFRAEMASILEACARRNPRLGVTGVLIYERGRFVQLLEGPAEAVDALLDDIETDVRHGLFKILWRTRASRRLFENWSMAFMDAADAPALPDAATPWERASPVQLAARLAFAGKHLSVLSVPVSPASPAVNTADRPGSAYA
ncbi:BLUF domain-containing protein [Alkalicaulis satelles]|uniref:BLUF domain-containing protein n=1 Tax=Alkalicaulis satelles TaxID=2609175 RepID=A0A5M6ZNS0_9PROT|nr:BLUF domain-containing protein [Alkalicaulis satelles]KAA5803871.1 BLUF domain-containing protein [Alkalicaulis satelles]